MYTKGSFASSSAPENSHTPQQPKVGGDDEAVSTDLSVSPQNDKIVQNSERNAATHVTQSSGAEYSLLDHENEASMNGVYDACLYGFKPTHHDPIVAALVHSVPSSCSWTAASDIAVGGEFWCLTALSTPSTLWAGNI